MDADSEDSAHVGAIGLTLEPFAVRSLFVSDAFAPAMCASLCAAASEARTYMGTSLIRKRTPLGP